MTTATRPNLADPAIARIVRKRAERLPLTQTETAALLGMSRQWVDKHERRAMAKLRDALRNRGVA